MNSENLKNEQWREVNRSQSTVDSLAVSVARLSNNYMLVLFIVAVSSCNSSNSWETETVNKCYVRITNGNVACDLGMAPVA